MPSSTSFPRQKVVIKTKSSQLLFENAKHKLLRFLKLTNRIALNNQQESYEEIAPSIENGKDSKLPLNFEALNLEFVANDFFLMQYG